MRSITDHKGTSLAVAGFAGTGLTNEIYGFFRLTWLNLGPIGFQYQLLSCLQRQKSLPVPLNGVERDLDTMEVLGSSPARTHHLHSFADTSDSVLMGIAAN